MEDMEYELVPAQCGCEEEVYPHTCPFAEEIHDDSETLCTCCSECEYQCMMDI